MKRVGCLFEKIISFRNLHRAAIGAASGKKEQIRIAHFLFHLEKEVICLQQELEQGIWQPSGFRVFEIRDPKPRRICAADFRDRVVHHAVCHVLGPVFDKRMIFDSWACRKNKGSHMAVKRAQGFCRRNGYFLKCDIRRYFDSVDHGVLKQLLRRIIKDVRLLNLLDTLIDHPLPGIQKGKGLPIGNLTSQYFANLYLGELDHQIKDVWGCKYYLRYMDDMLFFADTKRTLYGVLDMVEHFIDTRLLLRLKASATQVAPVSEGIPFLGFRIFSGMIRVQRKSLRRFQKRLRYMESAFVNGEISMEELSASIQSMIAHMSHANTQRMRQSLLGTSFALG